FLSACFFDIGFVIARKPVDELWHTPFDDALVVASRDVGCEDNENHVIHIELKNHGYADISCKEYFNSGVMLMDLERMRAFDFTHKAIEWLRRSDPSLKLVDQPLMNALFYQEHDHTLKNIGKRNRPLVKLTPDARWNCQNDYLCDKDASILHYAQWRVKPWNSAPLIRTAKGYSHYTEYHDSLQKSPFVKETLSPEIETIWEGIKDPQNIETLIPVVLCSDESYLVHAGVTVTSMLDNAKGNESYDIYVTYEGRLTDTQRIEWQMLASMYHDRVPFNLTFIDSTGTLELNRLHLGIWGGAALTRLILTEMDMFDRYDKVLYIDCDMIVYDISGIWNQSFELENGQEALMIAVKDICQAETPPCERTLPDQRKRVPTFEYTEYANSGLLLMNMEALRQDNFATKALNYMKKSRPRLPDQDTINAIAYGRIKILDYEYAYPGIFGNRPSKVCAVHFLGQYKPWLLDLPEMASEIRQLSDYHFYRQRSPWRYDCVDEEDSLFNNLTVEEVQALFKALHSYSEVHTY
ncbi:MAG TPA: glycosyltransferase, partial [Opitutales bacterium]|nr:glycosyltransferase [Opitutales bacterium]